MSADRQPDFGTRLKELKDILSRIAALGIVSPWNLLNEKEMRTLLEISWKGMPGSGPPDLGLMDLRIRHALHGLANGAPVREAKKLPDAWARASRNTVPLSWVRPNGAGVPGLVLTYEECRMLIAALKHKGYHLNGLPVREIYTQGRNICEARAKKFDPSQDNWCDDDIFDLLHYVLAARHENMNTEWGEGTPPIAYASWFARAKRSDNGGIDFALYRGVLIVKAFTAGKTSLIRTSHLQRESAEHSGMIRYDGLMLQTGDKHSIYGFRRDNGGNQSLQLMTLDGLNRHATYANVFRTLGGHVSTFDQFEWPRSDGHVGTSMVLVFDEDVTRKIAACEDLEAMLQTMKAETVIRAKGVAGLRNETGGTSGRVESATSDKTFDDEDWRALERLQHYGVEEMHNAQGLLRQWRK